MESVRFVVSCFRLLHKVVPNLQYFIANISRVHNSIGGSLIATDVVLTAAHCQGGKYDVVIGRHDLDSKDGESIAMDYEIPYPKYNDKTTDGDFNLVFLKNPTTQKVSLVNINDDSNSPQVGDEVHVMGWGDTTADDYTQKLADKLMEVSVNVISNQDCDASKGQIGGWVDSYNGQITNNMICARDNGEDAVSFGA